MKEIDKIEKEKDYVTLIIYVYDPFLLHSCVSIDGFAKDLCVIVWEGFNHQAKTKIMKKGLIWGKNAWQSNSPSPEHIRATLTYCSINIRVL